MIEKVVKCDVCQSEITGNITSISATQLNQTDYNIMLSFDCQKTELYDKHLCGISCLMKYIVTRLLKEAKNG